MVQLKQKSHWFRPGLDPQTFFMAIDRLDPRILGLHENTF
jgi:hypothetical protein